MKKCPSALLAVPLAASMLLAGCGGDPKPVASASRTAASTPTTSLPTTTTSSPTTTGPKADPNIPAAAVAHTTAGAEAFVRYFLERVNVAWTSPGAGILSPLCQTASKACADYEATATRLVKEKHRYSGDPVTIKFIGVLDGANSNQFGVLANVVQERRSEIDAAGKTFVTDKREDLRLHFQLVEAGQSWSVASIKLMK